MREQDPDETYANIRQILGDFIGKTIVDITQHDADEWERSHQGYILLLFEDGSVIKFWQGDEGFTTYKPGEYEGDDGQDSEDEVDGNPPSQ